MIYPLLWKDRLKYALWRFYTPVHPHVRDAAQRVGITSAHFVRHRDSGRQDYLLGTIAPGYSVQQIAEHLVALGFGNHFIAWKDSGQVVSLRYVEDFTWQYHVRIFEDGEVRGHYEYTPECYPILHLRGVGQADCRPHFHKLLEGKITPLFEG